MSPHRSPGPPVKAPAPGSATSALRERRGRRRIAIAIGIHAIPIALLILKATFPNLGPQVTDDPVIARPVIGRPSSSSAAHRPEQAPDRIVPRPAPPRAHDGRQPRERAAQEARGRRRAAAPNTKDSDITNLAHRTDAFAEDAGKARPEQGFARESKVDGDRPHKVHAGDMYAASSGSSCTTDGSIRP